MGDKNLKIKSDGFVTLNYSKSIGEPCSKREDRVSDTYFLKIDKLIFGEGRRPQFDNVKIPLTKEQYDEINKEFESFQTTPKIEIKGNLEIVIKSFF